MIRKTRGGQNPVRGHAGVGCRAGDGLRHQDLGPGQHNAFTDLIRWHGKWYCTFREADAHVGGDGKLRVLESADGKTWESVALVREEGIDLRDPKLRSRPTTG